jgi:hypothetical protein
MLKIVALVGFEKACALVDEGITAKAGYPIGWALAKAQGQYVEKQAKPKIQVLTKPVYRAI